MFFTDFHTKNPTPSRTTATVAYFTQGFAPPSSFVNKAIRSQVAEARPQLKSDVRLQQRLR